MNKKVIRDIDDTYKRHHTASRRGYCRVDLIGTLEPYKGIFGEGYIMRNGCHNGSTRFESITYYIKEGSKPYMPKDCVSVFIPSSDVKGLCAGVSMDEMDKLGIDDTSNAVISCYKEYRVLCLKKIASQNHFSGKKMEFLQKYAKKYSYGFLLSEKNGIEFINKFIKDKRK